MGEVGRVAGARPRKVRDDGFGFVAANGPPIGSGGTRDSRRGPAGWECRGGADGAGTAFPNGQRHAAIRCGSESMPGPRISSAWRRCRLSEPTRPALATGPKRTARARLQRFRPAVRHGRILGPVRTPGSVAGGQTLSPEPIPTKVARVSLRAAPRVSSTNGATFPDAERWTGLGSARREPM